MTKKQQLCKKCDEPTGRCEDDSLYLGGIGPLCEDCYDTIVIFSLVNQDKRIEKNDKL